MELKQGNFFMQKTAVKALHKLMGSYDDLSSNDELHITTGNYTTILEIAEIIQRLFSNIGKEIMISPAESKDEVQKDARNVPDPYIRKFWEPKTSVKEGITKVFEEMKKTMIPSEEEALIKQAMEAAKKTPQGMDFPVLGP